MGQFDYGSGMGWNVGVLHRILGGMAQDLAGGIQVVRVIDPTKTVEGRPAKMLWAAAVARDKAVDAVLAAVPQGCTAELTDQHLPPEHIARLKLRPGDVRKLI